MKGLCESVIRSCERQRTRSLTRLNSMNRWHSMNRWNTFDRWTRCLVLGGLVFAWATSTSAQGIVLVGDNFAGDYIVTLTNETDFVFDVFQAREVTRVVAYLGGGDDTFDASASIVPATVFARGGNDHLIGSRRGDRLFGEGGDDIVDGFYGGDRCSGGSGNDIVIGGEHPDIVRGNGGRDIVIGGNSIDQVIGDADQDLLIGGGFEEGEGNVGLAAAIWFTGADEDFESRVVAIFETGFTFLADNAVDFVNGGKEADAFANDGDTIITDGIGWPGGNSPPLQGDRVDAVIEIGG